MRRRTTILETVASVTRPQLVNAPPKVEQSFAAAPADDPTRDALAYLLMPIGALLRSGLIGLGCGMTAEAFLGWHVDGFKIFYATCGLSLMVRIVGDSETVRTWWHDRHEVRLADRMLDQQDAHQERVWQRTENAAQVTAAISSQPASEDLSVNDTIAKILIEYYTMKAGHDPRLRSSKLWSSRKVAEVYGFGRETNINKKICAALEKIADGYKLRPHTFAQAYLAMFGTVPENCHRLIRVADNPAAGSAVFVPAPYPTV